MGNEQNMTSNLETKLISKLNETAFLAYALLKGEGFVIQQTSENFHRFISDDEEYIGKPVTDVFFEFIGSELYLEAVMKGNAPVYSLEYIARGQMGGKLHYYTIEVMPFEEEAGASDSLLLLLLDTTVAGRLQQRLTQERNELAHEVQKHEITQIALRRVRDQLEERVSERTAELARINEAMVIEIEERRHVEEELLQVKKMEAIGQLAGGIAHDFNNFLTVINSYADLLARKHVSGVDAKYIAYISEAGEQAALLTRQLLAFSRKQVIQPEKVNINESISQISKLMHRLIGENISIKSDLADDLVCIEIDPSQFNQIIMNLAINARDAMPMGGTLLINTKNVVFDDMPPAIKLEEQFKNGAVLLSVSDTGEGMTDEVKARIFEPFFTTKTVGKGTGLGLSTVYGVITQANGHISVTSTLGEGARFDIFFPKMLHGYGGQDAVMEREEIVVEDAVVMVVDDEGMIRDLVRECLEGAGHTVLVAETAELALAMSEQYSGEIDLLVTDVVMPGVNGRELAERFVDKRPSTKVLYITGYNDEIVTQHGVLRDSIALLEKPFTADILVRKVAETLRDS